MVYPLDYGCLPGLRSGDGEPLDAWIGSGSPAELTGLLVSVDLQKMDTEVKLLLGCNQAEMASALRFHQVNGMPAWFVSASQDRWLCDRKSVRRFRPDPLTWAQILDLIEQATWAPSAHNRQPWRFAVLLTAQAKERLADRMGSAFREDLLRDGNPEAEADRQVEKSRQRILSAPAVILLFLDTAQLDRYPDPARQAAEKLMGVQSVAMAGQNLMLAAHAVGIGSVWMCAPLFAGDVVLSALDLPQSWQPMGQILLGYPEGLPPARQRRSPEDVTVFR